MASYKDYMIFARRQRANHSRQIQQQHVLPSVNLSRETIINTHRNPSKLIVTHRNPMEPIITPHLYPSIPISTHLAKGEQGAALQQASLIKGRFRGIVYIIGFSRLFKPVLIQQRLFGF